MEKHPDKNNQSSESRTPQSRISCFVGHSVTVNGSPAEIVGDMVRWHRGIGYFEFAEEHGGRWSEDGLEWWIDGKAIKFSVSNSLVGTSTDELKTKLK